MGTGHSLTWLMMIPGVQEIPEHVAHSIFITLLLIVTMWLARVSLKKTEKITDQELVPAKKMTYRNFFELIAEKIYGLTVDVLGEKDAKIYFPLVGTLFVYIFTSNLLGIVPGFSAPTTDFNTTLALGVFVYFYYNYVGIRANGLATQIKHLFGPMIAIGPLIFLIEVISHLIRPITLAIRLKWNMAGDHMVLGVFESLMSYLVPVPFLALGTFVSLIQALVFCLLTMVYISLSTAHDH